MWKGKITCVLKEPHQWNYPYPVWPKVASLHREKNKQTNKQSPWVFKFDLGDCHPYHLVWLILSFSHVQLFATLWTIASQAPLSMGFSRQECWSGLHFLLQGMLLTQGSKPLLLWLLYCRQVLYLLSDQRKVWRGKSLSCGWLFVIPWTLQSIEFSRSEYWEW